MSKKDRNVKQPTPILARPQRLEGDALYAWAQLMQREQQIQEAKQGMAAALLTSLGRTPGKYLLSNDGYIVKAEDQTRAVRQAQDSSSAPTPDPVSADSVN